MGKLVFPGELRLYVKSLQLWMWSSFKVSCLGYPNHICTYIHYQKIVVPRYKGRLNRFVFNFRVWSSSLRREVKVAFQVFKVNFENVLNIDFSIFLFLTSFSFQKAFLVKKFLFMGEICEWVNIKKQTKNSSKRNNSNLQAYRKHQTLKEIDFIFWLTSIATKRKTLWLFFSIYVAFQY